LAPSSQRLQRFEVLHGSHEANEVGSRDRFAVVLRGRNQPADDQGPDRALAVAQPALRGVGELRGRTKRKEQEREAKQREEGTSDDGSGSDRTS